MILASAAKGFPWITFEQKGFHGGRAMEPTSRRINNNWTLNGGRLLCKKIQWVYVGHL